MVKKKAKKKTKTDEKLEEERKKLGTTKVYRETEDNPDEFKDCPLIVVCKPDLKEYVYPIMLKLETNNIIRLSCMNNHISTTLRLIDLFKWGIDVRLQRKREMKHIKTKKILIVNEYILEKIPACRS